MIMSVTFYSTQTKSYIYHFYVNNYLQIIGFIFGVSISNIVFVKYR